MNIETLLKVLTEKKPAQPVFTTSDFVGFLKSAEVTCNLDPFTRLVIASCRAGSQANAVIAGHQAAVRRLFPGTAANAVTAFCVSEARGPHPRFINTKLNETNGQQHISGEKMWGTMAPAASMLYVAASTGIVDDQNQLVMVGIDTSSAGITQIDLPPERQAGDVPICDLVFEQTPIYENQVFAGDAYTTYIKPFRLIEDVFSTVAMQIALFRLGTYTGLSHESREDLLGLIVQGHAVAATNMEGSAELLLITSYLRSSQAFWGRLASAWPSAAPEVAPHWRPESKILTVAARARATRQANAWRSLGEDLIE